MLALPRSPSRECSLAEARARIRERLSAFPPALIPETVNLLDAARRVLARPLPADRDLPPFPRSTRDGYALRAAELAFALEHGSGRLRRAGEIRAGGMPLVLPRQACIEIMTGAPLPAGADAVVMLEHAQPQGEEVVFSRPVRAGDNFIPAGQEAAAGAILVPAGRRLNAAAIGLLAMTGTLQPQVYSRPRVAILATGDELVDPAQTPAGAQIRNSNSSLLAARIAACGGVPQLLPISPDDPAKLEPAVLQGLHEADLLILSGGASVGRFDLGRATLEKLGAEISFDAVRIRPGRPAVFGRVRNRFFFILPGNPVSTLVTFELLVRPALAALSGESPDAWERPFAAAVLETDYCAPALPLVGFVPARVRGGIAGPTVAPLAYHGSGDLVAIAAADAFLQVPENCARLAAGERINLLCFGAE